MQANAVAAGNEAGYRSEVLAKFPTLKMLDLKPVEGAEADLASLPSTKQSTQGQASSFVGIAPVPFPLTVRSGFTDEGGQQIIPTFLSTFFGHLDNDRNNLKVAYAPRAIFTFTVPTPVAPRTKAEGFIWSMPHQKKLQFEPLRQLGPHDIMRLGTDPAMKHVHAGPDAIVTILKKLPHTQHPLTDASKFVVDAWVLPNERIGAKVDATDRPTAVLFISVHGEYVERESTLL